MPSYPPGYPQWIGSASLKTTAQELAEAYRDKMTVRVVRRRVKVLGLRCVLYFVIATGERQRRRR